MTPKGSLTFIGADMDDYVALGSYPADRHYSQGADGQYGRQLTLIGSVLADDMKAAA